jgi:glycosyltransferase involved in cell wall biosynthesis
MGKPPKSLLLGAFRMKIYATIDFFSKFFLRFSHGAIVINKDVSVDYGLQRKSLIVEGGVGEEFLDLYFDKINDDNKKVIFLLSGTLWPINGTRLILDAMKVNQNSNIEIMFAGHGMDVDLILAQGSIDPRIKYLGYLTKSEMLSLYSTIDVLVNIRLIDPDENRYLFPSKLLEFMATGKMVVTNDFYGLGSDYKDNCVVLEGNDPIKLSNLLDEVSSWPVSLLEERGQKTKEFVKMNKTWDIQVLRILRFMLENKSIN